MKHFKTFLSIFTLILSLQTFAQVHIKGNVEIDMSSGLIKCDFKLTNIPQIKGYKILLNKGMNVKYFKNKKGKLMNYNGHYDADTKGEAIAYTFNKSKNAVIPEQFDITYRGAFPVYKNDFNAFDYKGVIAFNDQTMRATEQTKWYPVIYDVKKDKLINSYTYDLTINIKNGNTIFINGNAPKKGAVSQFSSKKAHPLLLFVGNYNFVNNNNGDYILNVSLSKETSEKIFKNIDAIKNSLAKNLKKEFTDNIYIINHKAINKRRKGSSWGFNTYPSFAFTGIDFNKLVNKKGKFSNNLLKFFGHEFGHNYFGLNVMPGKLGWFWLESFAEYLSYNVVEDLANTKFLHKTLINQAKSVSKGNFIPLNKITKKSQIGDSYRYRLAPLMLKCFEDTFGRNKINKVIIALLDFSKSEALTLEHFKKAAIQSGISTNDYQSFEEKFIINKNFKQSIINQINKKYK